MTLSEFYEKLGELRKRLFEVIGWWMKCGEPGKIYEGAFEVQMAFPDFLEDAEAKWMLPDWVKIKLHCYLVGPSRHYEWTGNSLQEAFERCKKDIEKWCVEVYDADCT